MKPVTCVERRVTTLFNQLVELPKPERDEVIELVRLYEMMEQVFEQVFEAPDDHDSTKR